MKVAIVGAGIIGLYLAWKLAKRREEVTVFERKEKVGKECCSGLFSERILEFIPESEKLIRNKIDFCLIHFPKKTLRIGFSRKFLVINHFQLDELTANLAQEAGVKIILKNNIKEEDLELLEANFERIIGCDGANSIVRKSLNLAEPKIQLGIQGFIPKKDYSNTELPFMEVKVKKRTEFFSPYVETWPTDNGFIWKIPRGEEAEWGIMENPKTARKTFEDFLRKNNLKLENIKSAVIPQGLIFPLSFNSEITLCGDASGLTKPWSGGGVIWGLIAANLLLKNFPDFVKYEKEAKSFFWPKIAFSKIAKKTIYLLGFKTPWILPKNYRIEGDFLI